MKVFSKSDVGLIRQSNQDACKCGMFSENSAWVVVCDGMGGVNGGNIASSIAVEIISQKIESSYEEGLPDSSVKELIMSAVADANVAVHEKAAREADLNGMGTTVVAAVVCGGIAHIAHAGDSRAYLISGPVIRQLTTDHSMVQEMVDKGDITEQQAKQHPQKNIITRALGVESSIRIDYCEQNLQPNDLLLICTDGLTNYVDVGQICQLSSQMDANSLTDKLIELAIDGGGGDNITVAIVANELLTGVDLHG